MKAGFIYAVVMFALGFVLGAIRVELLVPRFGATIAVLVEAPFMLVASWWACLKCIAHFRVSASIRTRAFMGAIALVTLLAEEIGLAAAAFGLSPLQYVLSLWTLPGLVGLLAQISFASFPLVQAPRVSRSPALDA